MAVIGMDVVPSEYHPRSVIELPLDVSAAGNVILRVGRENGPEAGWHQTEHVVLTPEEAHELLDALTAVTA